MKLFNNKEKSKISIGHKSSKVLSESDETLNSSDEQDITKQYFGDIYLDIQTTAKTDETNNYSIKDDNITASSQESSSSKATQEEILSSGFAINAKPIKIQNGSYSVAKKLLKKSLNAIAGALKNFVSVLATTAFFKAIHKSVKKLLRPSMTLLYKEGYLLGVFIIRAVINLWRIIGDTIISIGKTLFSIFKVVVFKPCIAMFLFGRKFVFDFVDPFSDAAGISTTTYDLLKETPRDDLPQYKKAVKDSVILCLKSYFKCFCNILNHLAPVAASIVLVFLVGRTSNLDFALEITYNGENLGYVENELIFEEAEKMVQSRVVFENMATNKTEKAKTSQQEEVVKAVSKSSEGLITDLAYAKNAAMAEASPSQEKADEKISKSNASYSLKIIDTQEIDSADTLCDKLISNLNDVIIEGTGVYIDNSFYGVSTEGDHINTLLKNKIAQYDDGSGVVSFYKDIQLKDGLYPKDVVLESDKFEKLFNSTVAGKKEYTIVKGDAPLSIAAKNSIAYSDLKALNPDIETHCMPGDTVLIAKEEQFLQVMVTKQLTYTREIPFETIEEKSSSKYVGSTTVKQNGTNGQDEIIANVSYLDGVEVDREVVKTTRLADPIPKKVVVGTKQFTVSSSSGSSITVPNTNYKGGFAWPTVGGRMTCGWLGYYRHYGVDICNSYGTPVIASAPGVVVSAGWNRSGYGYLVVIDHGNGYQTYYAHNSKLNVSPGQTVAQGQQIANMGQTGNAYGNHVHFEIHYNGRAVNPEPFLGI